MLVKIELCLGQSYSSKSSNRGNQTIGPRPKNLNMKNNLLDNTTDEPTSNPPNPNTSTPGLVEASSYNSYKKLKVKHPYY